MARIRGAKEHSRRLARLQGSGVEREVGSALFAAGNLIQVEAQISITTGAVSGAQHVPSKPGEPPKADTHRLADNIETLQVKPLVVEVSSNAPYSADLEWGTSKMGERPFMRPARAKKIKEARELVVRGMGRLVSDSLR